MVLFLIAVCIFGGFLLRWRRASLTGYFGSPLGVPHILTYWLGNFLVLALGIVAYWGAGLLLLLSDWPWAVLALFLGFVLRAPLMRGVCGPPRSVQIAQRPLPPSEFHYKVTHKKHLRWSGRVPIPDSSCDFVPPPGTVTQNWVTMTFPEPFGEYGQEERFYCTRNSEEFERACKDSPVVLGYCLVEPDAWRKAAAEG